MKYFKPGMIVQFPFDSYYFIIILKVLISEYGREGYSQSLCVVLTDEGPVKAVWLYEDLNKQLV